MFHKVCTQLASDLRQMEDRNPWSRLTWDLQPSFIAVNWAEEVQPQSLFCTMYTEQQKWETAVQTHSNSGGTQKPVEKAKNMRQISPMATASSWFLWISREGAYQKADTDLVYYSDVQLLNVWDINISLRWGWEGEAQVVDHDGWHAREQRIYL